MEQGKLNNWILISSIRIDNTLQIRVMDSGQPIPPELQDKIFNRFFTTKSAGKGTGLGLSFSKKIIERHHGRLFLDNNSPHTTFVIELPLISISDKNFNH
jgi:signal transduction histidine kinase